MAWHTSKQIVIRSTYNDKPTFQDKYYLKTNDFKIQGFKIMMFENKIADISFFYSKLPDGREFFVNDIYSKVNASTKYNFILDKDDFIQVIFGCYTQLQITQFGVVTYKGKQAIFGEDRGQKYQYLSLGYSFTSAFGAVQNGKLKMLGFWQQKLPKEDVIKYCNSLLDSLYNKLEQNPPQMIYSGTNYSTSQDCQSNSWQVQTTYQSNQFQDENQYYRFKNLEQSQNSMQKKIINNNKQEEIISDRTSRQIDVKEKYHKRSPFIFKDMSKEKHHDLLHPFQSHLPQQNNYSNNDKQANVHQIRPHSQHHKTIEKHNNHSKPTVNTSSKYHHTSNSNYHKSHSNHHSSHSNHHSSSNNGGGGGGHHHHHH